MCGDRCVKSSVGSPRQYATPTLRTLIQGNLRLKIEDTIIVITLIGILTLIVIVIVSISITIVFVIAIIMTSICLRPRRAPVGLRQRQGL